ncbi:M23 family metallopeptidase [Streptomyces solicathayae]|uniref:M23 family metallopeptidase n=1 Tax=Streptomyces solicathayae TaxID=3081768 RepID=A0ABZ0LVI0_9ACTN|nr:M23 family metallopeptidase [Streptomyces sp. HUAS YS2]WOX23446.1 M23 family metallopeptidase [Streptomyces sp. HUAS YS2]
MSVRKVAVMLHRALWLLFAGQAIASVFVDLPYPYWAGWLPALVAAALGFGLVVTARREVAALSAREPVEVLPPVTGRWSALNSPADRTPSHGTHQYGQTYAIDIVAESDERARPAFAAFWPVVRHNRDFPAFGAPLLAVADGTVVHAEDGQRDHLSRNSLPAVLYLMLVESAARALLGAHRVTGNHLVLDLGDGTFAMYAHLQRGSLAVRPGDRVTAGQELARCGNSGNSTEPHVHFQLMDGPDLDTARGVPFTWSGVGVPKNGETFEAGRAAYSA